MLTKVAKISTGALALAMMTVASPAAMAQQFDPAPSTTVFKGTLILNQTITLPCEVEVELQIDSAGQGTVTARSFSPGAPQCGVQIQALGTWDVDPGPGTNQVTFTAGATSIFGQCFGTAVASFNNATGEIVFNNTQIPGTPGPCTINGALQSHPQVDII